MAGISVTVIGAGGNIGSHLIPHLGRMGGVQRVTLVDRDLYEEKNLLSQDILPGDAGRPKALVQSRRLRRIDSSIAVEAFVEAVESVPLGRLRADVILSCLDSRAARQRVNEAAWRLGVPWVDAGVDGPGRLARVNVYLPSPDAPCLECAWSKDDYDSIEQVYPCMRGAGPEPAPTDAPSSLGALAASLQALECRKLFEREPGLVAAARQVTLDARWHKHYLTAFRRNPDCRFDHVTWRIQPLSLSPRSSVGELAARLGGFAVEGSAFLTRLHCASCGASRRVFRLASALTRAGGRCRSCGGETAASGFERLERLDGDLRAAIGRRTLASAGIRPGDILAAGDGRRFEIAWEQV